MAFSAPKFYIMFLLLCLALLLFSTWGRRYKQIFVKGIAQHGEALVQTLDTVKISVSTWNTLLLGLVTLKALVLLASATSIAEAVN
ncbi:putative transmembrane protein [Sesbania bispinosa]|nr:putative transmembrane protein [Sesbania bispinosa]